MDAPETRYATTGDGQVAFQVLGEGPIDLVFSHGFCQVDLMWDVVCESSFVRALASFSRVIRFDRRGSGASDPVSHGFFPTWEEWNRDLVAVLDAAGSPSAAIYAEAEAGPMAMMFAASHPDRVRGLVLSNTAARYAASDDYAIGYTPEQVDLLGAAVEANWGTADGSIALLPGLANQPRADVAAVARLGRAAATPRMAGAQYRHIFGELDARDALPLIAAPTLVLCNGYRARRLFGEAGDGTITDERLRARYVADRIPGARLVELEGDELLAFTGDFEPVVDLVAEFLTGTRPAATGERILATVVFTDIVSSTERLARLGDRRWREVLDAHDRTVRELIRHHRGTAVKSTGDGYLAYFDGPARAVDFAAAVARSAADLGLEITAGMHTGECERRGDDIAGLAVHVAARIAALAGPGEILTSRTVVDLVIGSGITFEDRGDHALKGVPGTWSLFAAQPR